MGGPTRWPKLPSFAPPNNNVCTESRFDSGRGLANFLMLSRLFVIAELCHTTALRYSSRVIGTCDYYKVRLQPQATRPAKSGERTICVIFATGFFFE